MTNPMTEPWLPPAGEAALPARTEELRALTAHHKITALRPGSPGRQVGHVAEDLDAFDVTDFEIAAEQMLGAEVGLFSDRVLENRNVSPDLVAATPL
jgi:hypothetical protein